MKYWNFQQSNESAHEPIALERDPEEILHTAASGYECDDPECICHHLQAEEQR